MRARTEARRWCRREMGVGRGRRGKGAMAGEIIGRREELLALEVFLEAVPAGGQALLLEGDAGIGKTALWQEGNRLACERGFRLLDGPPGPFRDAGRVRDRRRSVRAGGEADVAPVDAASTARARDRVADAGAGRAAPGGAPARAGAPLGRARACSGRAASRRHSTTCNGSMRARPRSSDSCCGALRASRWVFSQPCAGGPLRRRSSSTGRSQAFQRLAVEPLSIGAIHRLLWGRLALNLPRPELVRVHEIAGGNPFFALELGRAIARGAIRVDSANVALPESLSALVTERLRALPARVRETLVAVAALAAPSVTLLEPLAAAVVDDIEFAEKQGVVELDGDRIHFTHPLLAPACYAAMPLHRRRRLHRRLAELDVDLEERARHLAIAATGSDEEIAAALDAAATHARARGAAQAAAELAERAVALTPLYALESINRRRITAAEHCRYAGDREKAALLLEEVVGSSQPGRVRAEALSQLAGVRGMAEGFPVAVNLLSAALAEPGLESSQEVNILCELAWMAHVAG